MDIIPRNLSHTTNKVKKFLPRDVEQKTFSTKLFAFLQVLWLSSNTLVTEHEAILIDPFKTSKMEKKTTRELPSCLQYLCKHKINFPEHPIFHVPVTLNDTCSTFAFYINSYSQRSTQ